MGRRNPELKSVIFQGKYYSRKKNKRYYRRSEWVYDPIKGKKRCIERELHRDVWESVNGPIPKGFDIHHKDNDPDNNHPSNLIAVSKSDHARHHNAFARWNSTEQAKALRASNHRKIAENFANKVPVGRECVYCGGPFTTRHCRPERAIYCSQNCAYRYRLESKRRAGTGGEGGEGRSEAT
jgi:hypothetical protein